MSGPEEQLARTRLRASHADREQVIGLLQAAFVQGRLTRDEFGGRVDRALAARTYAELAWLTEDLPVSPLVIVTARSRPRPGRERPRPSEDAAVQVGGKVIAYATVIAILLWVAAIVTFLGAVFIAALGATAIAIVASALTGGRLLALWIDRFRSRTGPSA